MSELSAVAMDGVGAERPRSTATWALAARLARREVRRRLGRTALVVVLIAIPVIAMTIGSVAYRTARDTPEAEYRRVAGRSDLVIDAGASGAAAAAGLLDMLPAGSRTLTVHESYGQVTAVGGSSRHVLLTDLDLTDPITSGMVGIVEGRAPIDVSEVALDRDTARALGVGLGDQLVLAVPEASYRVVGIARSEAYRQSALMIVAGFDFGALRPRVVNTKTLVDLPPGTTAASSGLTAQPANASILSPEQVATWWRYSHRGEQLAWGWVAGALALTVMGVIVAAAFASSARRQLVTLGQLSANGADGRLLRRTLALQGAWSGLAGAVLGVVVGLALVLPRRGVIEGWVDRSVGPTHVAVSDLLVIVVTGVVAATVAAFVPARTVARVSVLSALAGRSPLGVVPRALVPAGVVLGVGGVGLVALGAMVGSDGTHPNVAAATVVLGGVAVLAGVCCLAPAIVAVFGSIAERVSGTVRLAARSLARTRTRSAAVVAAIAAAGALSVGVGTFAVSDPHDSSPAVELPANIAMIGAYEPNIDEVPVDGAVQNDPLPTFPPVPAESLADARAIVPGAELVTVRVAAYDPAPYPTDGPVTPNAWYSSAMVVADSALLDALGVSARDRAALTDTGVMAPPDSFCCLPVDDPAEAARRTVTADTEDGSVTFDVAIAQDTFAYANLPANTLITEARAAELGFVVEDAGVLLVAPHHLTAAQRDALSAALAGTDPTFLPADQPVPVSTYVSWFSAGDGGLPPVAVDVVIAAAALLFTLAIVAIALSLSAAETRDERDVLVALGASPRSIRSVSAVKAALIAVVGGVLAVPAGFVPMAVILAQDSDRDVSFPWVVALGCAAVIPLLVALAALAGSAIAQRVRPVRMSTLTPAWSV